MTLTNMGPEALSASDTEVHRLHRHHLTSSFTSNFILLKSLLLLLLEHDNMLLRREKKALGIMNSSCQQYLAHSCCYEKHFTCKIKVVHVCFFDKVSGTSGYFSTGAVCRDFAKSKLAHIFLKLQ